MVPPSSRLVDGRVPVLNVTLGSYGIDERLPKADVKPLL
jgi:hypothetical protein